MTSAPATTADSSAPADVSVTVLAVGGTGESFPGDDRTGVTGLLAGVTDVLDERFTARWVPYAASYGPSPRVGGDSYLASVADGVGALSRAIAAAADCPVMLIGYSQGAVVIRTLLAHPSATALLSSISAVGFVADPHQPPGVVAGCAGWGIAGPGPDLPAELPVMWIGAPDDVICNAGVDSLWRDVADLSGSFSIHRLGHWLGDALDRLRSADLQNAARTRISPVQWRRDVHRLRSAVHEARGYLPAELSLPRMRWPNPFGGRHVSYDSEPYRRAPLTDPDVTGCEVLAHWLQVQATLGARAAAVA